MLRLSSSFTLAVLLSACGGGDDTLSLSEFFAEAEDAFCDFQVGCGFMPDRATCEAQLGIADERAQVQGAIDDGRVEYDGEKASACLAAVRRQLSCNVADLFGNSEGSTACDEFVTGLVPVGGTCFDDDECDGDAECDGGDNVATCVPGTCVAVNPEPPPAGEGGDCTDARCQPGLYCLRSEAGARTCTPLAAEGEPCQGLSSCVAGLLCDVAFAGEGTCFDPPARGEQCDPARGFIACEIITDLCDPTGGVCEPRPRPGGTCNPNNDQCIGYAFCSEEGRCEQNPGEGDACSDEIDAPECLGDLDCVNGVCTLEPAVVCSTAG